MKIFSTMIAIFTGFSVNATEFEFQSGNDSSASAATLALCYNREDLSSALYQIACVEKVARIAKEKSNFLNLLRQMGTGELSARYLDILLTDELIRGSSHGRDLIRADYAARKDELKERLGRTRASLENGSLSVAETDSEILSHNIGLALQVIEASVDIRSLTSSEDLLRQAFAGYFASSYNDQIAMRLFTKKLYLVPDPFKKRRDGKR